MPCGIADHEREIQDWPEDNCACTNECIPANRYAAHDRCVCSHRRIGANQCGLELRSRLLNVGTWIVIVGQDAIRPQEDVVLNSDSLPDCNSVLHGDVVAQNGSSFNERMLTDVATHANARPWHNMGKGPNTGAWADVTGLHECLRVGKICPRRN